MKNVVAVTRKSKKLSSRDVLGSAASAAVLPSGSSERQKSVEALGGVEKRLSQDISRDAGEIAKAEAAAGWLPRWRWVLQSVWFNTVVYSAIMLNAVQMGLATDHAEYKTLWLATDNFFTALFTLEMLIKIAILGPRGYVQDNWNCMDCFLVSTSILDGWVLGFMVGQGDDSPLGNISILRVLRVMRMARLLKVFKELWMIIKGILDSLRTMFWVSLLLVLILYVCAILTTRMIGHQGVDTYPGFSTDPNDIVESELVAPFNNYMYFGTIPRGMYTLFCVVIMAEWPELGRPIIEQQPLMFIFFVLFIVFTTFGVMNVIIGVIVDNTMEAARAMQEDDQKKERLRKLGNLEKIRQAVFNMDEDNDGVIDIGELERGYALQTVQDALSLAHLPKGFDHQELMYLLDYDADGILREDEFMMSFFRLIEGDTFQRNCQMHAGMNSLKRMLKVQDEEIDKEFEKIEGRLGSMEASLREHADELQKRCGGGKSGAEAPE